MGAVVYILSVLVRYIFSVQNTEFCISFSYFIVVLPFLDVKVNSGSLHFIFLIINNSVTGAQQDGVEGFFRGLGRGIMGLITKPTLGVIDSVAMACDSIRRAVDLGYDVSVGYILFSLRYLCTELLDLKIL